MCQQDILDLAVRSLIKALEESPAISDQVFDPTAQHFLLGSGKGHRQLTGLEHPCAPH